MSDVIRALGAPLSATPPSEIWLNWAARRHNLHKESVHYSSGGSPDTGLTATLFTNEKGRIELPTSVPYLPISFTPTSTQRRERLYRQWVDGADALAEEMIRRGIRGGIGLPPGILDARPFIWAGLEVQIKYTFMTDLPYDLSGAHSSVRKNIRKAREAGFVAERSRDWTLIESCLMATEDAKGFKHDFQESDMRSAVDAVGDTVFRGYVVRSPGGEVVSGGIRILAEGGMSIDFVQGSKREALKFGVNQLMYEYVLADLTSAGAVAFDNVGANIKEIAQAKSAWGFPLVPYMQVTQPGARTVAHAGLKAFAALGQRRSLARKVRSE